MKFGKTKLYSSAAGGKIDIVRFLLGRGIDPSIKTDFGWAPLNWAAANGFIDCVLELIRAGAELSPVSDQSKTPLDLAMEKKQEAAAKILRDAGAKTAEEVLAE